MRISDWSSDVCSSDLVEDNDRDQHHRAGVVDPCASAGADRPARSDHQHLLGRGELSLCSRSRLWGHQGLCAPVLALPAFRPPRSEEHTSELQSLMRISYAVFCLKKKNNNTQIHSNY